MKFKRLLLVALLAGACAPGNREVRQLRIACDGGDAKACSKYGEKLENGEYALRDPAGAITAYEKACTGQIAQACGNVGVMYLEGEDNTDIARKPDAARAAKMFRLGCDLGGMTSCTRLGHLALNGALAVRDTVTAQKLFDKACKGGELDGCAQLATILADTTRPEPQQNVRLAVDLLKKTCDAKIASGCAGLGKLHAMGKGVVQDDSIAGKLFIQACKARDAVGCTELAKALEVGRGLPQDFNRASINFRRACEDRYGEACYRLADMIQKGAGMYRDPERAQELVQQACTMGFAEACKGLEQLKKMKADSAAKANAKPDSTANSAAKVKPDSIADAKNGGGR
jgi:TPR repeat protein